MMGKGCERVFAISSCVTGVHAPHAFYPPQYLSD